MGSGQQPSPLAEQETKTAQPSDTEPRQRMDPKRARSRDAPTRLRDETTLGNDGEPCAFQTVDVARPLTSVDSAQRHARRDPSPGSSSSSTGSTRRTQRSPIPISISSSRGTPSPASPNSQSSPTRLCRTTSTSATSTATAPAFRRGLSYVTTPTNQMTSSAVASGNGHMMAGAGEPSDIRRPRSNSHSASGENARPAMFSRPSLGGRAASSAAGMTYRSSPADHAPVSESRDQSGPASPSLDDMPDMPAQQYPLDKQPSFSPESDRDSGEVSPDADDEASPVHSPSPNMESLSLSPVGLLAESPNDTAFDRNAGEKESLAAATLRFGLPEAQAGANVSFPGIGTGIDTLGQEGIIASGAEVDPDVEGIPEALSMPRDLMPSEDAFEDEGLTTLERIFLLSRSEHAFHRSYIARMMGELLEDVDPCETVEYVLPLLNGFAMDEDESVKEAFASQLHRVLWYYFTTCDLIGEDDGSPLDETPRTREVVTVTSEGVKTVRRTSTFTGEIFPMITSGEDTPGSDNTPLSSLSSASDPSPASAGTQDSRKESQASTLSSSLTHTVGTPSSVIDTPSSIDSVKTSGSEVDPATGFKDPFLEEAKEKDRSSAYSAAQQELDMQQVNVDRPQIPVHMFTALIGSMLLSPNPGVADPVRAAIVAILAKIRHAETPLLDEWEDVRPHKAVNVYHGQFGEHIHLSNRFTGSARKMVQNEIMHGIIIGMGRLDAELPESMRRPSGSRRRASGDEEASETGSTTSSIIRGIRPDLTRSISRSSARSIESQSVADSQSTEMLAYKQQLQQEALMGRAISMNLIASIAEFVNEDDIAQYGLLNEVLQTAEDDACVKLEGALALAFLAKSASLSTLDSMLGLFENYVMDENEQVRQSACLCLPPLCKRIGNLEDRRSYAVRAFDTLLNSGNLVQYTALEIIGEIVHLFHDDPLGPPQELLQVYFDQSQLVKEKGETSKPEDDAVRQFDDPDRAVVSAFNLPAICLALGKDRWPEVRPTFKALCNITHQRITVSLAASVHEIAKIIGPELASQDLLLPFFEWLNGNDEIRGRALAQLPTFLAHLPPDDAADTLQSVLAMWETGEFRNWRHRETLANHAPAILKVFVSMGHGDLSLDLLRSGLFDSFQAIRDAAIKAVPKCLLLVKGKDILYEKVFALLADLATNEKFKHRKTYIACVRAFVDAGIGPSFFENHLLEWLPAMSDDLLDVKIALAKLVGRICAPLNKGGLYPHAPLRPLRLSEAIERLMNEPSEYVQKPLANVQPYRPHLAHSQRGSQFTSDHSSPHTSQSSTMGTPRHDTTPPAARRSSSASMLLRVDSDHTVMPSADVRYMLDETERDDVLTAGPSSAPVALMTAPFSSPGSNGTQTPGSGSRHMRRRSISEQWETRRPSSNRPSNVSDIPLMEPVQVGMNDPFSATFAKAIEDSNVAGHSRPVRSPS